MIKPHHIDTAYQWVCQQRRNHADIWHLRFHWAAERTRIMQSFDHGDYSFAPLQVITKANGTVIHLWSSPDALEMELSFQNRLTHSLA